jgi:hypothetical protein
MSKIIHDHKERLNIRWHGGFPIGWDGQCEHIKKPHCSECVFLEPPGRKSLLTWNRSLINPNEEWLVYEVILCHFQSGKHYIANSTHPSQELVNANPLYYSYPEGFQSRA